MRKILLAIFVALLLGAGQARAATEQRLQVSAWLPTSWDGPSARASLDAHLDWLGAVSPFWYGVREDGTLVAWAGARDRALVREARAAGVRVLPTISNQYQQQVLHAILNDADRARAHRQAIVAEVQRYDYDGIDIDYENLAAADKALFSQWVEALAQALHARGKLLAVTVQPKTFAAEGWDGPGAQDYGRLAAAADELRLMTYGWCWASGCVGSSAPGPIAPIHWMQRVVTFAKSRAPANKLVLGVHLYGYDWSETAGRALVWTQAEALSQQYHVEKNWWEQDEQGLVREPWFSYEASGQHHVTFANADSVAARAQLARDAGLRGIVLWRLGGEDPSLWQRLPRQHYRQWLPLVVEG
jgi:spore germination protein YaaH